MVWGVAWCAGVWAYARQCGVPALPQWRVVSLLLRTRHECLPRVRQEPPSFSVSLKCCINFSLVLRASFLFLHVFLVGIDLKVVYYYVWHTHTTYNEVKGCIVLISPPPSPYTVSRSVSRSLSHGMGWHDGQACVLTWMRLWMEMRTRGMGSAGVWVASVKGTV